jgi:hypothetical protein
MFQMKKLTLFLIGIFLFQNCQTSSSDSSLTPSSVGNGTGGSLARFTLSDGFLYTVTNTDLSVFDVNISDKPNKLKTINLGFGAETIFPYKDALYIGTTTGMRIYDNKNPANPQYLSTYSHIYSCDPVVVQGTYAYVTLRSGTNCRRGQNSLDIIDVSNPSNPKLVKSIPMLNPHGLAVDGPNLFICEGSNGLKSFDLTDPLNPIQREFINDVVSYDVIPTQKRLIVTGKNGIYQYDYTEPKSLKLLSKISIE